MDGARIWNALVAKQDPNCTGLYLILYLSVFQRSGAPVGSVLLANKATIARALRVRKILGGGMRQVGYLAAAGIYALDHNISALKKITEERKSLLACLVRQVGLLRSNLLKLIS
jgi:threonine aldolase